MKRNFPVKVFHGDHLVRYEDGRPLGRVILRGSYDSTEDRIYCVLMTIPKQYMSEIKGQYFWIDGEKYQIAKDTSDIRFSGNKIEHRVNSFYLEKVAEALVKPPRTDSKLVSRVEAMRMAKESRSRIEAALAREVEREAKEN